MGLERELDFNDMLGTFCRTQAVAMQASAQAWTTLAHHFDPTPLDPAPEPEQQEQDGAGPSGVTDL